MQSSDLADILNFKESGPYLFDEDGRIIITEQVQKKEDGTPEIAGDKFGKELEKQYKLLLKQAEDDVTKRQEEYEDAINKTDTNQKIQANTKLENAQATSTSLSTL